MMAWKDKTLALVGKSENIMKYRLNRSQDLSASPVITFIIRHDFPKCAWKSNKINYYESQCVRQRAFPP